MYEIIVRVEANEVVTNSFNVEVLHGDLGQYLEIQDPFSPEEHAEYAWYLEHYLQDDPFAEARANSVQKSIRKYGLNLINSLQLQDYPSIHSENHLPILITIEEHKTGREQHLIYWEILENLDFWLVKPAQVIVRRICVFQASVVERKRKSADRLSVPFESTINVLLLGARDLSHDANSKEEPDPFLALRILLNMKDWLRSTESDTQLRIEVVRPGSFQALTQHLESATARHGIGYYHLVHFDVHGTIHAEHGPSLHLSSPDADQMNTIRQSPADIASLLQMHGIKNVVMNACHSASVRKDIATNMAHIMIQNGIKNVLAMSFKILAEAAQAFLKGFYAALILEGHTFSFSAQAGRETMRTQHIREARLSMRKPLMDYAVPVMSSNIYAPSRLVQRLRSANTSDTIFPTGEKDTHLTRVERSLITQSLVGRNVEILKLEKKIMVVSQLYVSGRAGVGKTAMIQHILELWTRTNFIEKAVYVNFSRSIFDSITDFSIHLGGQLGLAPDTRAEIKDTQDPTRLAELIWDITRERRVALVFDGLHKIYSLYSLVNPSFSVANYHDYQTFLSKLTEMQRNESKPSKTILILASRRTTESNRLFPLGTDPLELALCDQEFCINSLRLADSLLLIREYLKAVTGARQPVTSTDLSEFELMLALLDGNPAAILSTVQLKAPEETWSVFRSRFFNGQAISPVNMEIVDNSYREEMSSLLDVASQVNAIVLTLGMFWTEAPNAELLIELLSEHNIVRDKTTAVHGLLIVHDRGFIELAEKQGEHKIAWIHPLLSQLLRYMIDHGLADVIKAMQQDLQNEFDQHLQNERSILSRTKMMLVRTVTLAEVEEDSEMNSGLASGSGLTLEEHTKLACEVRSFREDLLSLIESHSSNRSTTTFMKGYKYADKYAIWEKGLGNLAVCIQTCLHDRFLALSHWPNDLLGWNLSLIRETASPVQLKYFSELYLDLLDLLITKNGGKAFPRNLQRFSLVLVTTLAVIHKCELHQMEKFEELTLLALEIIDDSERVYGSYNDAKVKYLKSMAYRYRALFFMDTDQPANARIWFKRMLDVEDEIFVDPAAMGIGWSPEEVKSLAQELATDKAMVVKEEQRLENMASGSMFLEYHRSRRDIYRVLEIMEITRTHDDPLASRKLRSIFAKATTGMHKVRAQAEKSGAKDIANDERWWPKDLYDKMLESLDPISTMQKLEEAYNSGDQTLAQNMEKSLMRSALSQADFPRALSHGRRLENGHDPGSSLVQQIESLGSLIDLLDGNGHSISLDKMQQAVSRIHDAVLVDAKDEKQIEALGIWHKLNNENMFTLTTEMAKREVQRIKNLVQATAVAVKARGVPTNDSELKLEHAQLFQAYANAMAENDPEQASIALDRFEKFLNQPQVAHLKAAYDKAWFEESRNRVETLEFINEAVSRWADQASAESWTTALQIVHQLGADLENKQSTSMQGSSRKLLKTLEQALLEGMLTQAEEHLSTKDSSAITEEITMIADFLEHRVKYCEAADLGVYRLKLAEIMGTAELGFSRHEDPDPALALALALAHPE